MNFASPRRLVAYVAAIITAALVIIAPMSTPSAEAQQRNMVIFGDSLVANPNTFDYLGGGLFHNLSSGNSSRGLSGDPWEGCPQGNNWGRIASGHLGLVPWDYSCSGAVSMSQGPQVSTQVSAALRDRALHHGTQRVVLSYGFNDTYNNDGLTRQQKVDRFVGANAPQIARIRAAAPNARIQVVGYPSITGGDNVCLFHVGPNIYDATPFPDINRWQWDTQEMQRALARATGVEFVDMKGPTANNHMCAPDDQRMVAGLVDFYAGPGNLPFHVNDRGHYHIGAVVARS